MLELVEITEDPALQLRGGCDTERIEAMEEFVAQGGVLPPITVVGDDNLLADGHHRLLVASRARLPKIEANRVPGGRAEAVAIAIRSNDTAAAMPLTRSQRNAGIKVLLSEGWTQDRIAKETGTARATIVNIGNALSLRGELGKATKAAGDGGGRIPSRTVVLPKSVHKNLSDTTLARIASVPVEQQQEFAEAVAATAAKRDGVVQVMSEPRVREAIRTLKSDPTITPQEAVRLHAPSTLPKVPPKSTSDVEIMVERRLAAFLDDTITIDGTTRDFWQVVELLAQQRDELQGAGAAMAEQLRVIAVKAEHYATKFVSNVKAVSA